MEIDGGGRKATEREPKGVEKSRVNGGFVSREELRSVRGR